MAIKILVHTQLDPRIVEVRPPTTLFTLSELDAALKEWENEPHAHSFDQIITSGGKEQLSVGKLVGVTGTLQNARLMFTGRTTPLEIGGTCTTGDPRGLSLIASGGDFENSGVYAGCTVINTTTWGMASIHTVVGPGELAAFKLSGGSRDDWQVGDGYRVYPNLQCTIEDGNLVAVDADLAPILPILGSPGVQVDRTSDVSAALISGSGGATAEAVADAVWDHDSAFRLLGLSHENSYLDNAVYDGEDLESGRLRVFDSRANVEAATPGGSETTGLTATYLITASYVSPGILESYRMVLE